MRRRHGWMVGAALALSSVAGVRGQEPPDPKTDPALNDPSLEEKARDLERRGMPPAGIAPSGPADAGIPAPANGAPRTPLRREGTFLVRQRGSLVKLAGGEWAFVFHRDAQGQAERPMILMRSQHLARMQQLAGQRPEEATFLLGGQVFVYRGSNYLLVAPAPPVLAQPEPGEAAPPPPVGPQEPSPGAPSPGDRPIGELLAELEAQRDRPRALGLPSAPVPPAAGDSRKAVLPEGTVVSRRRGRLVRVAGGETAVMFDSDADSAASVDPPLILLPCLALERMERVASDRGESFAFEISGRVFAYDGRNYLLPTMFQVYAPTDLERRQ